MRLKSYIKYLISSLILLLLWSSFSAISLATSADSDTPNIASPSAVLMDARTGIVLWERNMNERRYPASTTKVMTAIVVLEHFELSDTITITSDSVEMVSPWHSTAGLVPGENISIEQALYLIMVVSGNEVAYALAKHVSSTIDEFAVLMNDTARRIGLTDTNFTNPSGAHDDNQFTTAHDLALLGRYAMQDDFFRLIAGTATYVLPPTNIHSESRTYRTTNSLLTQNMPRYFFRDTTGIKTGFTTPAGRCLIASARRGDFELITVVMGGGLAQNGSDERFLDTIELFRVRI